MSLDGLLDGFYEGAFGKVDQKRIQSVAENRIRDSGLRERLTELIRVLETTTPSDSAVQLLAKMSAASAAISEIPLADETDVVKSTHNLKHALRTVASSLSQLLQDIAMLRGGQTNPEKPVEKYGA